MDSREFSAVPEKIRGIGPIFMIGVPRSGTSILSEAFSCHEYLGWISPYMAKFPKSTWLAMFNRICDFPLVGLHLRGKKRQNSAKKNILSKYLPYSAEAYGFWQPLFGDKFLRTYVQNVLPSNDEIYAGRKAVSAALHYQGKDRFFAKFTGPPRIKFLTSVFPDAYFINVVRDPRAVVSSLLKTEFWTKGEGKRVPWWEGLPERYIEEIFEWNNEPAALAAVQWKRIIELARIEGREFGKERFVEIKYEDFVESPIQCLERLFKRVQLNPSVKAKLWLNRFGEIKNMNHKYLINLKAEERDAVERITYEVAADYGYNFNVSASNAL